MTEVHPGCNVCTEVLGLVCTRHEQCFMIPEQVVWLCCMYHKNTCWLYCLHRSSRFGLQVHEQLLYDP